MTRPVARTRQPRPGRRAELGGDHVEGRQAVRALLQAGRRAVRELWVDRDGRGAPPLADIERLAVRSGVLVRAVPRGRLLAMARTDAPQGVVARAAPIAAADLDSLLARDDALLVALDGVTDPGNLGAVLRAAETAGATGAVVTRHRSARLTPAAVKAAAGAVEHVPIAVVPGIPTALERAARAGVWSVGLDPRGPVAVFDLELADRPVVVVLGGEGRGLAPLTVRRCDVLASIPQHGHVESLNVAAAAAVACHAVAWRRHR